MFTFQSIIRDSPLQVYCTALVFLPSTNGLKKHFWKELHPWIRDASIAEADIPKAKDETNYVNDLAFTPDGRQIASGSRDELIRIWDMTSKAPLFTL
jgi:WD40 repeat protein